MKLLKSFAKEKLLFLSMLTFVFVASSALVIANPDVITKLTYHGGKLNELPVLASNSNFPIISAQGALAVDLDSGVTLYDKAADQRLLPASTTKIMTALVAMDYYSLNDVVTIPIMEIDADNQRMGLIPGEQITFENLLYGLLVYSASDAAMALAENYPGGLENFVAAMNQKAALLHLENTHFVNPVGLDGGEHYSTAKDMVRLSEVAMENPVFAKV